MLHKLEYLNMVELHVTINSSNLVDYKNHDDGFPGADLGLLAGGSQSVVVICRSTYEPGGMGRT